MTRLGVIDGICRGRIFIDSDISDIEPGAAVVARGPSGDRFSLGYILDAAKDPARAVGSIVTVSANIGYGHGGEPDTPLAWTAGDVLVLP